MEVHGKESPPRSRIRQLLGLPARGEVESLRRSLAALQRENGMLQGRTGGEATASGVPMSYGRYEVERNTALQGQAKFSEYDKMEHDPRVKAGLNLDMLPLITADWEMEPGNDSERANQIAEFCSANLLRKGGDRYGSDYWLQTPWEGQRLYEILDMLRVGFAAFQPSYRQVDGMWVYDRLQWLEPATIDGTEPWKLDEFDNILGLNRRFEDATDAYHTDLFVPVEQLKLYVWELKGARYEGRPKLRSKWGPWYRKEFILRQAMMWAQKVGSPPPWGAYPQGWDETDKRRFREFIEASRGTTPAETFLTVPMGEDGKTPPVMGHLGSQHGDVDRMRGMVDGENAELSSGSNQSDNLGETATGSRALGGTMQKREYLYVQAISKVIQEQVACGVANVSGEINDLARLNFADAADNMPRLVCSKINPMEHWSERLEAWERGVLPKTPEVRRQIAEPLGINIPDDAWEEMADDPVLPGEDEEPDEDPEDDDDPPDDDGGGGDDGDGDEEVAASALDDFRDRIAGLLTCDGEGPCPKGLSRHPSRLELLSLDLAERDRVFREGEVQLRTTVRKIRRSMIDDLLGRVNKTLTPRQIESQSRSSFKRRRWAVGLLRKDAGEVASAGETHVGDEIERQTEAA